MLSHLLSLLYILLMSRGQTVSGTNRISSVKVSVYSVDFCMWFLPLSKVDIWAVALEPRGALETTKKGGVFGQGWLIG